MVTGRFEFDVTWSQDGSAWGTALYLWPRRVAGATVLHVAREEASHVR